MRGTNADDFAPMIDTITLSFGCRLKPILSGNLYSTRSSNGGLSVSDFMTRVVMTDTAGFNPGHLRFKGYVEVNLH